MLTDRISQEFRKETQKELGVTIPEDSFILAYRVEWYNPMPQAPNYEFNKRPEPNYIEFLSNRFGRIRIEPREMSHEFVMMMKKEMQRLYEPDTIRSSGT